MPDHPDITIPAEVAMFYAGFLLGMLDSPEVHLGDERRDIIRALIARFRGVDDYDA